jgi:hypothetical protein
VRKVPLIVAIGAWLLLLFGVLASRTIRPAPKLKVSSAAFTNDWVGDRCVIFKVPNRSGLNFIRDGYYEIEQNGGPVLLQSHSFGNNVPLTNGATDIFQFPCPITPYKWRVVLYYERDNWRRHLLYLPYKRGRFIPGWLKKFHLERLVTDWVDPPPDNRPTTRP